MQLRVARTIEITVQTEHSSEKEFCSPGARTHARARNCIRFQSRTFTQGPETHSVIILAVLGPIKQQKKSKN